MEKGALKSCGYYERGGMSGGKYIARVALNRDGKVIFDLEKQDWYNLPVVEKHTEISAEKFAELQKMLEKYDFSEPHDEYLKELRVLDAPSVSVSVNYENISFGTGCNNSMSKGITKVTSFIMPFCCCSLSMMVC